MKTLTYAGRFAALAGVSLGIAVGSALPAQALEIERSRPMCAQPATPAAMRGEAFADRPTIAEAFDLTGTANVRVDLDPSGRVHAASIARSTGSALLDAEAMRAARGFSYAAETRDCQNVPGSYIVVVDFSA